MNKKNTLVFSIALNGYQWRYRKHLDSHAKYAERLNYHYVVVTRPFFSKLGIECCWLKLTLMYKALLAGYKYVVFFDADAMVKVNCPCITSLLERGKDLYMVKGYSSRFNSGVMIVRNSPIIRLWLLKVINNKDNKVEPENDVGWGENSHIIELSKGCSFIKELPQIWNNTYNIHLDDYIRHHNFGPLRIGRLDNLLHKIIFFVANRLAKLNNYFCNRLYQSNYNSALNFETKRVLARYPCFSKCCVFPQTKEKKSYQDC